jgi:DNA-binding CsgD family transcriptional regulator
MTRRPRRPTRGRGGQRGHEPRARIRDRQARALELSLKGKTQSQIASELHVSQPAVSKMLRRAEMQHSHEIRNVERIRARVSLRLEYVCREAAEAWELSKGGKTRRRQRRTLGSTTSVGTAADVTVEDSYGEPWT